MSGHDSELVFGELDDDPNPKAKRSPKQKGSKKSSAGSVDMDISGGDARLALLQSKLEELSKHANINFDDDMPITSPVGSPGDDHLDSLNDLLKLKQQLEEEQARRSEPPEDEDVELDSFIDVQSLLENLNQSDFTRPSVPKMDTVKFNELCQQIRERDTMILSLEARVREMDRETIDLKEMINERDKLIGSKNEAVAVVQKKFKKELEERDFELKRTQQVLFDMEKTLSSVQNNWKQEKERLNAEIQAHAARCSVLQEKASRLDDIQNDLDSQQKEFTEKEAQMIEKSKNQINKLKTQFQNKLKSLKEKHNEELAAAVENDSKVKELENRVAELEEEKGNFLLQLVDLEEQQELWKNAQQELLQRDQELTHLKEFYDPQIAQLTTLNENLEQTKDELSSVMADLTKNQELVKELENSLRFKEDELRSTQVRASDEAFKFQLLLEEKNNLVLQIESLRGEIEQQRTATQSEIKQTTDNSQSVDGSGFIDWGSQPGQPAATASDWWSPKENVAGDWGSEERVQFAETMPAGSVDQQLQYLQSQLSERDNHIHDLNFQLDSLQTSVNELQIAISNLTAVNEEVSRQNQELMNEKRELGFEAERLKEEVENIRQVSPFKSSESPAELSLTLPEEAVERIENISLFRAPDSVDSSEEEKKKLSTEIQELKVKNGKIVQKFKALKDKYDGVLQECKVLKQGQELNVGGSAKSENDEEMLRQLEEKDAKIAELTDLHTSTKQRLAEIESQALVQESKVSNLTSELDSLMSEKSGIVAEYEVSKQQLEQLLSRLNEVQDAHRLLQQEHDNLVQSEARHQRELERVQAEIVALQNISNRHETTMETVAQYEQKISSLSHELQEKTQVVDDLSSQKSEFEAKLKALQEEQAAVITEGQTREQQLVDQINQFRFYLDMNQQQAQTLQQELLQRDQELTHLKEFYDPQIAQLTTLNENLEQTKDELSSVMADLTKNQELVKELENSLRFKEDELRSTQVRASDEAFKFQLLLEEKNNLVLQIESLRGEIEQQRTATQSEIKQTTDNSQSVDGSGFIDWGSQPGQPAATASDWWSPKENVAGDWGSEERVQFAETMPAGSVDQQLQYLQSQLSERDNQLQDLNFQMERLQVSANELNQGVSSLSAANERFSNQNKQLLDENSKLSSELMLMKTALQTTSRSSSESPVDLAGAVPVGPETNDEKQKLSAEMHELKVKNGKMLQKFKVLKDKHDALVKEHEALKRKNEFSLEGTMEVELLDQLKQKDEAHQENAKIIMELRGEKEQLAQRLDLLERANDKLLEMKEEQGRYIEQLAFEKKQLEQEISGLKWKLEEVAESNINVVVPSDVRSMEAVEGRSAYQEDLDALRNQNYLASQEITSLQQDNADLISAVEELNRRNLLLQSGQPQPVQVHATATVTTSVDVPSQPAEGDSEVDQLRRALHHERNEKVILERKIELLQTKILEIEASEIRAFEESFMLKSMTRILEMDNSKYQDELQQLLNSSGEGDGGAKVRTLQNEVLRLVDTLQERDKRCEELTCEITRLLEERDGLQLKLSNVLKHNVSLNEKCNEGAETSTLEVPTFDKEELQLKLAELEQVNFSINLDLRREREARRIVQEQLLFSQSSRIYRDLTRSKPVSLSPIKSSSPLPPRTPVVQVSPVPASIPPPVHIFTPLTVTPPEGEGGHSASAFSPPSPVQEL